MEQFVIFLKSPSGGCASPLQKFIPDLCQDIILPDKLDQQFIVVKHIDMEVDFSLPVV